MSSAWLQENEEHMKDVKTKNFKNVKALNEIRTEKSFQNYIQF